ncbi:uncharacterized protein, YigZ family [Providencia stuartii]|nr:uncharacterized protein, YigZ family [Providencia stuartii]
MLLYVIFGGIKLGTGGLVKAYGNGAQQALKLLPTQTKVPQKFFQLVCDYAFINTVEQASYAGQRDDFTQ